MTEQYHDASAIAQHMTEILRTITIANGYLTDIGAQRVFRGRRKIDDDHVPCAVLVEGDDKVIGTGVPPNLNISQSYVVGGYVKCDPDNPNDAAHLAASLERLHERARHHLGATASDLHRHAALAHT